MIDYQILLLILPFLIASAQVPKIPNGIVGEPEVICDIRQIRIKVRTANGFSGNLYSKGFFHKSDCRLRGNSMQNSLEIVLPVDGDCGIRRKRVMNPRGILLDTTVILMFHPVFLTQNDRSYHVQCQYFETDRTVTNALDVSMQPASELPQSIQNNEVSTTPICKYEVLMGSESGPPLSHATVGDAVYHRWFCDGENKELYCMTVHSCVVDDGQGYGQKLIDEKGCTLDEFLIKELNYKDNLEAGQMSNVFKFADKPTVFFSCMIRVEMKESSSSPCFRPTENCSNSMKKRKKVSKLDVMTKKRVSNDIPPTFPRPPNDTKLQNSDYSSDMMESDNDAEMEDDDGFEASNIPPAIMSRLIRRDINNKLLADYDVSAPSVDVIDIPETEVGKFSEKVKERSKNDVCAPKLAVYILMFIFFTCSLISIFVLYLIMNRLSEKSASPSRRLPHPDFEN